MYNFENYGQWTCPWTIFSPMDGHGRMDEFMDEKMQQKIYIQEFYYGLAPEPAWVLPEIGSG